MPTPTGNPAWVRTNDHWAYGGNVNKTNYESVGTVNPRTDLSAENLCRIAADLAAVARTAPFSVFTYTCNDSSPAAPTLNGHIGMATGPTGSRNGDGDTTWTWTASPTDPYGVAGFVNINVVIATGMSAAARIVVVTILASNQIRIRVYDAAGAAVQNPLVSVSVYTG